ncbi:hypothetical protein AncyloWKF20_01195 [Ancylobacter sp. WKF20]|uniref:hypothetical protein n=1 Tax=Ancylobacter sp. WKF20 TaxID=3039801 RepID=UPI0024342436|nr:hypothetical protein [Ancylobacter sp. WKF20]WGD30489.1 hypothetical protein AncyloWKF20_01195 [Ancylobacter sp. WKF20]
MRGQTLLRLVLGAIAALAVIWFVSSFFVLKDDNPRGSLTGAHYAATATPLRA